MNTEEIRIVRTACPAHCGIDSCGIDAHVKGDKVIKLEPAEFPDERYKRICLRGLTSLDITYHPDRLKFPMKRVGERGEGKFERISWDEAFSTIAEKFSSIAEKHGWPAIGWTPGGPGAGTTKFGAYLRLASLTQSTRVSAWGYGDAGLPCGSRVIFGAQFPYALLGGTMTRDENGPEIIVAWGTNPAESQPLNMMRRIMDAKEKGTLLSVIDPRFSVTASKADQYLGLKPATDPALALGLMHVIFDNDLEDREFILRHTVGPYLVRSDNGKFLRAGEAGLSEPGQPEAGEYLIWDMNSSSAHLRNTEGADLALDQALDQELDPALKGVFEVNGIEVKPSFQLLADLAEEYTPQKSSEITGVPINEIISLGKRLGSARTATFITHMGFTRTYHGDISLRAMATVATVTGNVAATFSGGHKPTRLNWDPFLKAVPGEPSYSRMGILQLYEAITNGDPYPVKALFFAFINFLNQCVDSDKIINELFPKLDFIVAAELFMTPTAKYADILLPACSFLEFSDYINGPYPFIQLQKKVIEPLYESKSDVDIAAGIAEKLGFGKYYEGGEEAFIDLILDSDSLKDVTRERLEQGPIELEQIPDLGKEIDIPFSTASGKIEIYSEHLVEAGQALPVQLKPHEIPLEPEGEKFPLALINGHSRFRTHSMFANVDSLLEMNPEPLVAINPEDALKRNIKNDDEVTVFNDRGVATLKALVSDGVMPGVVDISEGWWLEQFKEGSLNHLTHDHVNPVQLMVYEPNMAMNDVAVEVKLS